MSRCVSDSAKRFNTSKCCVNLIATYWEVQRDINSASRGSTWLLNDRRLLLTLGLITLGKVTERDLAPWKLSDDHMPCILS